MDFTVVSQGNGRWAVMSLTTGAVMGGFSSRLQAEEFKRDLIHNGYGVRHG